MIILMVIVPKLTIYFKEKKAEKKDLLCSILKPARGFSPRVGRVDWLTQYCNLNAMEAVMP